MLTFLPRRCAAYLTSCLGIALYASLAIPSFCMDAMDHLIEGGHWKRVRTTVQGQLKTNRSDAHANYVASLVEENFGDIESAVEPAERAVALDPKNATYHAQVAKVYALQAEKAGVLKQIAFVHKMHKELDAALAIDPRDVDALLVQAAFEWKAPAVVGGSRVKALQTVAQLRVISPLWGGLMEARLFQQEDVRRAQVALEEAVKLNPPFYRAQALLADFCANKANPPRLAEAEQLAKRCIQAEPERAAAYGTLAHIYARQGRFAELEKLLAEAEKSVPDDLSPYYFAADALLKQNEQSERAAGWLRKYLTQQPEALAPTMTSARTLLAQVTARKGSQASASLTP